MRAGAPSSGLDANFWSASAKSALPAVSPVTAHARHDHGTARAIFLHIMGVAHAHSVRPRIVAWNDTLLFIVRRDAKPARRPIGPAWRAHIFRRGLCEARTIR